MITTKEDLLNVIKADNLTYQQKLSAIANTAERMFDPRDLLNYTEEEYNYLANDMICDLKEGHALYRPRYVAPNYSVFLAKGCQFLELDKPENLDDVLDGLLIIYSHVPSITTFPVYVGDLDALINPFLTDDEESDYLKIKRFLNHIDKVIADSFCHANIGPEINKASYLILRAAKELKNPTPNITLKYNKDITPEEFLTTTIDTSLVAAKPSIANDEMYSADLGEYTIVSCYNALPKAGGAYTLPRLRLGTIALATNSLDEYLNDLLPSVTNAMASIMDKRIKFLVEESNFFETSFLQEEGFISRENFSAMFGMVGLANAVNHFLKLENIDETYGKSVRGDEIGHAILKVIEDIALSHEAPYCSRTNDRYLMHAQVGAFTSEADKDNNPAHRVIVGQEPILPDHLIQSAQFHKYFTSGVGDLFAFDQSYVDHPDAITKIVKGYFANNARYFSCYLFDNDLVRVTGYLAKRSGAKKAESNVVLRDTDIYARDNNSVSHVLDRKVNEK